jgi:hypothetical protein
LRRAQYRLNLLSEYDEVSRTARSESQISIISLSRITSLRASPRGRNFHMACPTSRRNNWSSRSGSAAVEPLAPGPFIGILSKVINVFLVYLKSE